MTKQRTPDAKTLIEIAADFCVDSGVTYSTAVRRFRKALLTSAIIKHGSKSAAADAMGIARMTVWRHDPSRDNEDPLTPSNDAQEV